MKSLVLVLALVACTKHPDAIGVADCDAYQSKMAACAEQVGGNVGEQLDKLRWMMRKSWQHDIGRPDLPGECRAAIADMQRQLPQCAW